MPEALTLSIKSVKFFNTMSFSFRDFFLYSDRPQVQITPAASVPMRARRIYSPQFFVISFLHFSCASAPQAVRSDQIRGKQRFRISPYSVLAHRSVRKLFFPQYRSLAISLRKFLPSHIVTRHRMFVSDSGYVHQVMICEVLRDAVAAPRAAA